MNSKRRWICGLRSELVKTGVTLRRSDKGRPSRARTQDWRVQTTFAVLKTGYTRHIDFYKFCTYPGFAFHQRILSTHRSLPKMGKTTKTTQLDEMG